eukprot:scaffold1986_cov211-Skeletonema_marinoi.AAC.3
MGVFFTWEKILELDFLLLAARCMLAELLSCIQHAVVIVSKVILHLFKKNDQQIYYDEALGVEPCACACNDLQ